MSEISYQRFTHSYQLTKLTLISNSGKEVSLVPLFNSMIIYENVFNLFLSGSIALEDDMDIIKNLPIVGNEELKISFSSDATSIKEYSFRIYKIAKDEMNYGGNTKKTKALIFYFTTKDAILDKSTKLSRKFSGSSSTIVSNILTNIFSTTITSTIATTTDDLEIFSNFWSPSKVIAFAVSQAKTESRLDYVFFQTLDGYMMESLSELMSKDKVYDLKMQEIESKISRQDIQTYKFNSYFDYIENSAKGVYASTNYKYNLTSNTYSKVTISHLSITDKYTINGKKTNVNSDFIEGIHSVNLENYDVNVLSYRKSIFSHLQNFNFSVQVGGDFNRKVGDIYEFNGFCLDNESLVDNNYTGKCFCLGIAHIFGSDLSFKQNLRLVKNGFFSNSQTSTPLGDINA